MEKCHYTEVLTDSENYVKSSTKSSERNWFFKQLLICSGVWTSVFLYGLNVGAPTVFIPQIRKEANDTNAITSDMGSWITSAYSFSALPFVVILCIITRFFGRKIPFTIATLASLIGFIILYCSSNIVHILSSEIMQGVFCASQTTITIMVLTEYISPKYRGMFLSVKIATFYWGVWVSNAIGTFFNWRNIPLCGIICSLYILATITIWVESPYWLASRGKFKECAAAHRSLKGCDEDSEKELEALINSQKDYIACYEGSKLSVTGHVVEMFKILISKEFFKPTSLSIVTATVGFFSGKLIFTLYAIDVLKEITNSESTAYMAMLIIDGFTVLSMYAGCSLAKYIKRRTLLLVASSIGSMFLFTLSLYLYLISRSVIVENKYVTISLFVAFSIAVSCGPLTVCISVYGELIPLKARSLSVCIVSLFGKLVIGVCLKLAPLAFRHFGMHGTCLSFGIASVTNLLILYKYLPETKDKTLQEIADSMKGIKSNIAIKGEVISKLL